MLKRAGRRLLVSPWFAAGAGVVIATAAIVVVPHDMSFQGAIRIHHCKQLGCTVVSPEGVAPAKPAGTGLQLTPSPSSTSPLTGMTFSYQVVDQNQFGFIMQMTIRSRHSLGDWKLSFVIRGASDVFVLGARWQQSGTNGGIASNYIGVTESVGYSSISGKNSDGVGSSQNGYTVQFQVHGTGAPSTPVECSYDGYACTFQRSHSQVGPS